MRLSKWTRAIVLAIALVGVAGLAFGQGRGNGKGGGNGGGPGEETTPNNLSVPAIFVGGTLALPFPVGALEFPELIEPAQEPIDGYTEPGFYYVQGIHQWQADSFVSSEPEVVYAKWGDNLIGDAKLKVGSPIRVEVGLYSMAPPEDMTGWEVIKLEPGELDRVSPYGTKFEDGSSDYRTPYVPLENPLGAGIPEVRVYDAYAEWTITDADGNFVLEPELARAEINSTGRIVYGYNLRVGVPGEYTIQFHAPNIGILDTDPVPEATISEDYKTVTLTIDVVAGGGNGGGKGGGRPSR